MVARLGGELPAQAAVGDHVLDHGGEAGGRVGGDARTALGGEDVGGAHRRQGDHRQPGGHGFEQHQALGFGARGEHEHVGRRVAVGQALAALQVADEAHAAGEACAQRLALQAGRGRAFAGDHEHEVRALRLHQRGDLEQEADVLLVRDAADVERHRRVLRDVVQAAEMQAVAAGEVLYRDAGGQDLHRRAHAIAGQAVAHRGRGHHHRIDRIALRARHPPRQSAQRGGGQEGRVVVQVFLEKGVVGQQRRPAAGACGAQAGAVGGERGLDVHQVTPDSFAPRRFVHRAQAHQTVFGVEGQAAAGNAHDAGGVGFAAVARHEQAHVHVEGRERAAEGGDRRRHAIHARKEDVGNHQYPDHVPSMRGACYRAVK